MVTLIVKKEESGQTLEKYIRKVAPLMPNSLIYKLFRKKDIKVNGHWQDNKFVVSQDDEVRIYIDEEQFNSYQNTNDYQANDYIKQYIIYEDENILLINKPRGMLIQGDSSGKKPLDKMVVEYLIFKGEYDPSNHNAFKCGPVHRLDRNTSGIVIFGKNIEVLNYLSRVFKDHSLIEKHYETLVSGTIEEGGKVSVPLKKDDNKNLVFVSSLKDGGKEAITIYNPIKTFDKFTLLDIKLVTGRTHQIRVHMAYISHPVVGDNKYGDFTLNKEFKEQYGLTNQFLHAKAIKFGKLEGILSYLSNKTFEAKLPSEYLNIINLLK